MKKLLLLALVALTIFMCLFKSYNKKEVIRVRIIANSDSSVDQKEKERIKDVVLYYLNLNNANNYDDCFKYISNTYKGLELDLKKINKQITVDFSKHTLYNKTYNNNAIKNEECYTLYVILGEGKGANWWGSVYPKYLTNNTPDIKYESLLINVLNMIKENFDDSN